MKKQAYVTLTEVARSAGVSLSTASRVFSRPGRVGMCTRNHVLKTAEKLGYHHDLLDVPMENRLHGFLAVVVTDLENIVSVRISRGVQRCCQLRKFGLSIIDTQENVSLEAASIRGILNHVDGLILGSSRLSDNQIRHFASYKPIVVLNRVVPGVASIRVDESDSIDASMLYLRQTGHHSVSYMQGPENSWQNVVRLHAAVDSADKYGLDYQVLPCAYPVQMRGLGAFKSFMRNPTDAVLAFNDDIAIEFIRYAKRQGMAIPEQVSVLGIDDNQAGRLMTPMLSTIRIPHQDMGFQAAQMLIDEILHKTDHRMTVRCVPAKLILRESTGEVSGPPRI